MNITKYVHFVMNATEYCKEYSHDFLDVQSCKNASDFTNIAIVMGCFAAVLGLAKYSLQMRLREQREQREHWFDAIEKSPPTLSERFFEALKTRIPEHTHELSDRNPFKKMAKLFNGVQSAQAVWRRIRG